MTSNEIRNYTNYLASHNIFQDSEIDINEFLFKMVSSLYNLGADEKSMRTIELQTSRFLNWFFTSMGIDRNDVETLSYQVKLKLFPKLIPILRAKGSSSVINYYVNLILSLGMNVNVYYVSISKTETGVQYDFIPHEINKNVPLLANKNTLSQFLFKHRDSLEDYMKSNVFPIKTNIIYYNYVDIRGFDKFPDWIVDVWIGLHCDPSKQVYIITDTDSIIVDASDLVDVLYYMKSFQRENTTNGVTQQWLSFSELKVGKEEEFLKYFDLFANSNLYTRRVGKLRESILKLFNKSSNARFDYLEEKYPKIKDVLGKKLPEKALFDMITVLDGQSFLINNNYPDLKYTWIKYVIGSVVDFKTLWKLIVEPIKDLFQLYFMPVYTESISNTDYTLLMKSIFQNMFMDTDMRSFIEKQFVDRTLLTNNKYEIQRQYNLLSTYRKLFDISNMKLTSENNDKFAILDDFDYILKILPPNEQTKVNDEVNIFSSFVFEEVIKNDTFKDRFVVWFYNTINEMLYQKDYNLIELFKRRTERTNLTEQTDVNLINSGYDEKLYKLISEQYDFYIEKIIRENNNVKDTSEVQSRQSEQEEKIYTENIETTPITKITNRANFNMDLYDTNSIIDYNDTRARFDDNYTAEVGED